MIYDFTTGSRQIMEANLAKHNQQPYHTSQKRHIIISVGSEQLLRIDEVFDRMLKAEAPSMHQYLVCFVI